MALTAEITRHWPNLQENGLFHVGVKVTLKDDGVEVRSGIFTEATHKGADVTLLGVRILNKIQAWIDRYKDEKQVFNHAKYEALRIGIGSGLDLT